MGLILLYHRVSDLAADPQRLAVRPDRFSKQLEVLKAHFHPLPLSELIEHAQRNAMPNHAVAVTFDDGYGDNLEQAKPLLEKCGVAATVFVATSYVGGDREFWWDDLERLLLTEGQLPRQLRLRIGSDTREWNLGAAASCDSDMSRRHAGWNVLRRDDPTSRHRVYRDLCGVLRTLCTADRDAVLRDLSTQALGTVGPRKTHRVLTAREIPQLTDGGVIDVGAHSASHPTLSALTLEEQKGEIASSTSRVEALTGRKPSAFAYPFGTAADYTTSTIELVRGAGYSSACAATPGRVSSRSDPLRLPRLIVRDWDSTTFLDRLKEWQ